MENHYCYIRKKFNFKNRYKWNTIIGEIENKRPMGHITHLSNNRHEKISLMES